MIAMDQSVEVPYGSFTGCVQTQDRSALEPGILEHKFYCTGIGPALEMGVQGSRDRNELVAVLGP